MFLKGKVLTFVMISLLLVSVFLLYSKYSKASNLIKYKDRALVFHDSIQKVWSSRKLVIPDSIYSINSKLELKPFIKKTKGPKLISYFDADCSDCVNDLKKWSSYIEETIKDNLYTPIFIASSSNRGMLKHQVLDQAKFKHKTFYDVENDFTLKNDIPDIKGYKTFLISDDNNILYIGTPIYGELFKREINEILEEN